MKKSLLLFALVAMMASPAMADLVAQPVQGCAGHIGASPRGAVVYLQEDAGWGYGSTSFPQNWDDDMLLDVTGLPEGPWLLDSFEWAVWNHSSSAGPMSTIDVTASFYNWDIESSSYLLAGSHTWTEDLVADFGGNGLEIGWFGSFSMTNLNALWGDIALQQDIMVNIQFANPTGGATRAGPLFSDVPPTVGSSDPYFSVEGEHGYWFGGASYMFFGVDVLPEPATLVLLAIGGFALLRRR
jgi:hypothetical protein